MTFLRAAGAKRGGPTFSGLWNLCSARRLSWAAAELGNRQSRMRPHGVMPGRLFCYVASSSQSEPRDGGNPDSPRIPDSPAVFLESRRGYPPGMASSSGLRPPAGPRATWFTIAMTRHTISPRSPPGASLSK